MRNTLIILWLMCLPFLGQAQNKGSQNLLDSNHIEVKDIAQQLAKQQVCMCLATHTNFTKLKIYTYSCV